MERGWCDPFIHSPGIGDTHVNKTDKSLSRLTDCKSQVDPYSTASPAS